MREIILINVTGKDKPGLTASLTGTLARYKVAILDIGQAVIHDYLSLGILVGGFFFLISLGGLWFDFRSS